MPAERSCGWWAARTCCGTDRLEFYEGAAWSEAGLGVKAISDALVTGRPVQLFSPSIWSVPSMSGPATRRPSGTRPWAG
ncbi:MULTISPECIES: hypothetical protein [unclassified Pseudarthrobacter]|uniref:hypothetical protein n=1 Tax=unclassified Pseudarthrobacter TaxID=2647000 RepID=UPI00363EFFB8